MSKPYSIGNLSQLSGVNVETIRYYEKVGLLPPAGRALNGYREYDGSSLQRLAFIRRGRELGFTIDEIRGLLGLADHPNDPCADADQMTRVHLDDINDRIRDLQRMRRTLRRVADCNSRTASRCQLLMTLAQSRVR